MISVLTSAISRIIATIPKTILQAAFKPTEHGVTLDERIMEEIVRKRVLIDCNIFAGKLAKIPVLVDYIDYTMSPPIIDVGINRASEIYRIPPEVREHRNIAQTLRLTYCGNYAAAYPVSPAGLFNQFADTVGNLAQMALNSRTMIDANLPPKVDLLSGNMIRCTPPIYSDGLILECLLEYDDNFTNLSQSSIKPLQRLILCATKSYCYNTIVVDIDMAALSGGQIIGVVKNILDGYADEDSKYDDLLKDFRGSSLFDPAMSKYMILNSL